MIADASAEMKLSDVGAGVRKAGPEVEGRTAGPGWRNYAVVPLHRPRVPVGDQIRILQPVAHR